MGILPSLGKWQWAWLVVGKGLTMAAPLLLVFRSQGLKWFGDTLFMSNNDVAQLLTQSRRLQPFNPSGRKKEKLWAG